MANLKDIQRQIKSVSNTQKTTRAMKLVSTAKLRRAEELAKRSRLYAAKMNQVIAEIAGRIKCNKIGGIDNRSFEKIDNPTMVDIVFVTADKGLCGGFNIQTIKAVKKLIKEYKEAHAAGAAWPEITQGMIDVGILDMEIYIVGTRLIMIMDTVWDFDHEKDMETLATKPRQSEWETYVSKFQRTSAEASADEK